jgi:ribosomal-protein-alanine N-acetyltransferase
MSSTFPGLNTSRLILRQIVPEDVNTVFEGFSNPEVIKYYGVNYTTLKNTQGALRPSRVSRRGHGAPRDTA